MKEDILSYQDKVNAHHEALMNKTGKGNDFVGWVEWPNNYDKEEFERIKTVAAEIETNVKYVLYVESVVLI